MAMIIRSFCLSDSARVPKLFEDVMSEECYDDTIVAFANQLAWDSELVLVASIEDEVIGVVVGTIEKDKGLYHRVVVAPEYRNMGIGTKLVQKLQERFIQRKVKEIGIKKDSFNDPLLSVWKKMNNSLDADLKFDSKIASRA